MHNLANVHTLRALAACLLLACNGKGDDTGASTGSTSESTTGTVTTGTSTTGTSTGGDPTASSGTTTDVTTTTSSDTTDTTATTAAITTGEPPDDTGPDECASSCGSEENCYIDEEGTTGAGTDDCDEGFHCVAKQECSCVSTFCVEDCVPDDPMSCPRGKTCDPNTGVCM